MPESSLANELTRIVERVDAGVDWLSKRDSRWASHVDGTTLDLSSPTHCILSQVFRKPWLQASLSRSEYIAYGFLAPDGLTGFIPERFDYRDSYYYALTNRWRLML
jgi:hypothetical protein